MYFFNAVALSCWDLKLKLYMHMPHMCYSKRNLFGGKTTMRNALSYDKCDKEKASMRIIWHQ